MARNYGIPYMGSKQKLVDKIIPFILARHEGTTDLYDLFGGGGSVALYAVSKYPRLKVHYNELSTAVGGLMEYLKDGKEIPFDFVKRPKFERDHVGNDWWAGLLQTCWTFGNNQKSYLYGVPIQDFKEELSMLVMTGKADIGYLESFATAFIAENYEPEKVAIRLDPKRYSTPYQRRIVLSRQIPHLGYLLHMVRLERLVQISNMPSIKRLEITSGSGYQEVPISGVKPILYCDPPYENTAEYREGGFDHKAFYNWCMAQPYPVYISSYKVSDPRFKLVKAINTRSLLGSAYTEKATYNYENVYWNGVS